MNGKKSETKAKKPIILKTDGQKASDDKKF